jgi:hypothetical protein
MAKSRSLFFSFVEKFKSFLYGDKSRPYEKPRRIIQNQALIQVLFVLAALSPMWLAFLSFRLVAAFPSLIILLLTAWAVTSLSYIGIKLYYWKKDRQISFMEQA